MRILMIGSALTVNGGIQRYILNLLGSMDLDRYPVDLLATRAPAGRAQRRGGTARRRGEKTSSGCPATTNSGCFSTAAFLRRIRGTTLSISTPPARSTPWPAASSGTPAPAQKLIVHSHIVYPPRDAGLAGGAPFVPALGRLLFGVQRGRRAVCFWAEDRPKAQLCGGLQRGGQGPLFPRRCCPRRRARPLRRGGRRAPGRLCGALQPPEKTCCTCWTSLRPCAPKTRPGS